MDNSDLYIFKAKATIISAGAGGFKPSGWPIGELTADGHVMAYRAGAEITGKEFEDPHGTRADSSAPSLGPPRDRRPPPREGEGRRRRRGVINAEGDEVPGIGTLFIEMEFEAHAGRAPLFRERGEDQRISMVGGAASGMSVHTSEGVWPINTKCATTLPGLYAAGDSLGTMQVGSVYSTVGVATAGASVTGARAGLGAAEYALKSKMPTVDEEELIRLKKIVEAPLERKGGFSPRWVTQVLQNITKPYFMLFIKHGKRMEAALTLVEFMKDHLAPKLFAKDPHELRLAHETKNMILNAEIKLRSSLFRTESRGWFYREDYPRRDDPNWLAWIKLKEEKGKMKLWKEPIPKEWWPDLSKPYEERYPARFPGE
jgi:succinate dehydrogenase/fumarate reductase flavoprotein subunit